MSLRQQIVIFISSMMLILLLGTFSLNVVNTKNFLEEQLSSHAQDTATSLGLSLSTVTDPNDKATMATMINAIFDRGYYLRITLKDTDGKVIYERTNPDKVEGVPQWFIRMVPLAPPSGTSLVQAGWFPIGNLEVVSHPGYAYYELWKNLINMAWWFIAMAILLIALALYALKYLLKPLTTVEKQAEAIVRKEYIVQESLPSATELKRVVIAMNGMVQKMRELFERDARNAEKLQRMAYQDAVTGFSNRQHFEMRFESWVDPEEPTSHGFAMLLHFEGMKALNEQYGYLIGDKFLQSVAKVLKKTLATHQLNHNNYYVRLNGVELLALIPQQKGLSAEILQEAAQALIQKIQTLLENLKVEADTIQMNIAITPYAPQQKRADLMIQLDRAMSQAQALGANAIFLLDERTSVQNEAQQWQQEIELALKEKRFKLFQQPALNLERKLHDMEVLVRLEESDGTLRSAGYFMPLAEKLNLAEAIECFVIQQTLAWRDQHREEDTLITVNLSENFVRDASSMSWLIDELGHHLKAGKVPHFAFELSERMVHNHLEAVKKLADNLRQLGIQLGVDHVGANFKDQFYLMELMPDYIKLDAGFSQNILLDEQTQTYVNSLAELAKGLDIEVIAMSVETEEQAYAFLSAGVHFYQGYLFGAPAPLDNPNKDLGTVNRHNEHTTD